MRSYTACVMSRENDCWDADHIMIKYKIGGKNHSGCI